MAATSTKRHIPHLKEPKRLSFSANGSRILDTVKRKQNQENRRLSQSSKIKITSSSSENRNYQNLVINNVVVPNDPVDLTIHVKKSLYSDDFLLKKREINALDSVSIATPTTPSNGRFRKTMVLNEFATDLKVKPRNHARLMRRKRELLLNVKSSNGTDRNSLNVTNIKGKLLFLASSLYKSKSIGEIEKIKSVQRKRRGKFLSVK